MSEAPARPRPWWLRRWAVTAMILIGLPVALIAVARMAGFWAPFYIPSEAMSPTLMKGDRLFASMRGPGELRRGDVILFETPRGDTYVKRLAGLPGDRIELEGGQVWLNGRPVALRAAGTDRIEQPFMGANEAQRFAEQFPGEARPHIVWDLGYTTYDDFPETVVKPGHVFVLGDNRDQSADSRVPPDELGSGQVPIAKVRGRPLFHSFFSSKKFGTKI